MNVYSLMWDVRRYGERYKRINACKASANRKAAACARVLARMTKAVK